MALPTLTKTWNFNVNQTFTSSSTIESVRNLYFNIKQSLQNSGGWQVIASSNGSVANTNDNWISTSSLNWPSGGARSWIILKHPTNNSQFLMDLINSGAGWPSLASYYSRNGWNVSGALSTSSLPSPIDSGDSNTIFSNGNYIFDSLTFNFVLHYMYSSDGYCHRMIVYSSDVPIFFITLDTPETSYNASWAPTSPQPSTAMVIHPGFPTFGIVNVMTLANFYTNPYMKTRVGPVGSTAAQNISLYLSAEAYNTTLLTNGLQIPNDFTSEYPMLETGLVSTTAPYVGKIGKLSDLWFGVTNFTGSPTYPNDNTRQFVQHGILITPWNGSVMLTRA